MRSAYSCNASRKARRTGVELQTEHSTRRGYNSTTCSQIRPSTAARKRNKSRLLVRGEHEKEIAIIATKFKVVLRLKKVNRGGGGPQKSE